MSTADQFFAPGHTLTLSLTVDQAVFEYNAFILKPFLPFTKSQVLLVELQPHISGIPSPIILKVYDPRFINNREQSPIFPERPWSLSLENLAAERRKPISGREDLDNDDEVNDVDLDSLLWEEDFYRYTEDAFHSELAAYSRLKDLQGVGIPRCYASGNLAVDPRRLLSPHVLVLEYIPSESLRTINPSSVPRSLARSLIATVRSIASHGVIHSDLRPDNILFSREPSRVVVVDFGESILRREDESDSEWESVVELEGDETHVKHLLHKRGIRHLDPVFPILFPHPRGADDWNAFVNTEGRRWCVPTEDWTGPGGIKLDVPVRWKLRDDVASWLTAKKAGLLIGVDPPRPGSPDYVEVIP